MNVFSADQFNDSEIKVLQISDLHLFATTDQRLVGINTEASFLSILNLAQEKSWPPDLIFLTGDLSQDSSEASYHRLIEHLAPLAIPCFVLPGNHDTPDKLTTMFNQPFVSYQPFLHYGEWLFAFLNSETPDEEGGTLDEREIERLANEINSHPNKKILICLHHQLKPVGSEWIDSMKVVNPESLLKLITKHSNIRSIIHGHIHQAYESKIAQASIYGSPSTCFQFKPLSKDFAIDNAAPGYRWLKLQSNGEIQTDIIRLDEMPADLDTNSSGY